MLRTLAAGLIALGLWSGAAAAQDNPVVVELYTSQGCSSCPPADAFLAELAKDPNVLPLAFHVDYWDRLGWKDTLATPAYTQRQYNYAASLGNRLVWTPQFIIQGTDYTRGNFRAMVAKYVRAHAGQARPATVRVTEAGGGYSAILAPRGNRAPSADIIVATYTPRTDVAIKRGENAGRTVSYVNTVTSWDRIGRWDGRSAEVRLPAGLQRPFVVILQEQGPGAIMASAAVR